MVSKPTISFCRRAVLGLAFSSCALALGASLPSASAAATLIGPLTLTGGSPSVPAVQVPSGSLRSYSFTITGGGSSKGWGGGGYVPKSATVLTVSKVSDSTSLALQAAAVTGAHFKSASISVAKAGAGGSGNEQLGYCLSDALITSVKVGASSGDQMPEESLTIAYSKAKYVYGTGAGQPCTGTQPPVTTSLLGVRGQGASVLARVDCLSANCRGILTVSLPPAACKLGKSLCAFTGGVRVGPLAGGKVHFGHDGTATLGGGDLVGVGGAGRFAMGDGSVRIVRLSVPAPLRKWLAGHTHTQLGTIIVVRGSPTAIVAHDVLDATPKLPPGPAEEKLETPTPAGGGPTEAAQSISISSCSSPLSANPLYVLISGSLIPARGGVGVTLTYTPTSGPPPLPSPLVDSITTEPGGSFGESFDREQGGKQYSWSLVASVAAGGGYSAAQSAPCAIPIP